MPRPFPIRYSDLRRILFMKPGRQPTGNSISQKVEDTEPLPVNSSSGHQPEPLVSPVPQDTMSDHPDSYIAYSFTEKNGKLQKINVPWKDPQEGEIVVKVLACGVCGRFVCHLVTCEFGLNSPPTATFSLGSSSFQPVCRVSQVMRLWGPSGPFLLLSTSSK